MKFKYKVSDVVLQGVRDDAVSVLREVMTAPREAAGNRVA
jgi:hypothetical protein